MIEAFAQAIDNIRANKLRSFLTCFGILWGIIAVVVLSATGEGFQRGNQAVLEELGKNIAIVWGGRTTMQAGGSRAGREIHLTLDDARAIEREAGLVAVVSPEINRGLRIKSRYNAATVSVHGIEPQYQAIRTLDIEHGRGFVWADNADTRRVAVIGAEVWEQLFAAREGLGETIQINAVPYAVIGRIRRKEQDSNYSGPDNDKIFVPFSAMAQDFPRPDVPRGTLSQIIVAPKPAVIETLRAVFDSRTGRLEDIDWPLARDVRHVLARHKGFNPEDRNALAVWDTSLESLLFARMVGAMREFFTVVGVITLALGGLGVMNIMLVAVKERTREIGVRKALGATTRAIERQFFLEGFFLTMVSGTVGFAAAAGLCALVNLAPMPVRFQGMVITWESGLLALAALVTIGVVTSTYPARRAAELPPVEALRYEM